MQLGSNGRLRSDSTLSGDMLTGKRIESVLSPMTAPDGRRRKTS